jgi:hypothetical protein
MGFPGAYARPAGYGLAPAKPPGTGRVVWQLVAGPDDTRQPCWLERRQALNYMAGVLDRLVVVQ